jgi:glycosyltransferase involved in cell wall biosynthesis
MTVVFITQNHPPTFCGIGDYTANLAYAFHALGIETHLICNADQKTSLDSEVQVHPIVEKWNNEGFKTVMEKLAFIKPDWILMQYVPHGFNAKGLPFMLPRLYNQFSANGYGVFTFFHEFFIRTNGAWKVRLKVQLASAFQKHLAKKILNKSEKAATSIDLYAKMLNKMSDTEKVQLIPIGSNILPHNSTPSVKMALKATLSISEDAPIIATFGNRNITDYLADFDKLAEVMPNFIWLICGKTSTPLETLKSRSYIRYAGAMPAFDIYKHLQLADVYFSPDYVSLTGEGGSCNKSTALACGFSLGIPVIGIKGDMNNALLKNGENILLVDMNQKFALYQALKNSIQPSEYTQKLGEKAKELYENTLNWHILAVQHLTLMTDKPANSFFKSLQHTFENF